MNEQLMQEILKRIDTAVGAAACGGKWAFEQLVKREIICAWEETGVGAVLLLAALLCAYAVYSRYKIGKALDYDGDIKLGVFGTCLIGFLTLFLAVCFLISGTTTLAAPEAAVIKQLLGR